MAFSIGNSSNKVWNCRFLSEILAKSREAELITNRTNNDCWVLADLAGARPAAFQAAADRWQAAPDSASNRQSSRQHSRQSRKHSIRQVTSPISVHSCISDKNSLYCSCIGMLSSIVLVFSGCVIVLFYIINTYLLTYLLSK